MTTNKESPALSSSAGDQLRRNKRLQNKVIRVATKGDTVTNTVKKSTVYGLSRSEIMNSLNVGASAVVKNLDVKGDFLLVTRGTKDHIIRNIVDVGAYHRPLPSVLPDDYIAKMDSESPIILVVDEEEKTLVLGNIQDKVNQIKDFFKTEILPTAIGYQIAMYDVDEELKLIMNDEDIALSIEPLKRLMSNAVTLKSYEFLVGENGLNLSSENAETIVNTYFKKLEASEAGKGKNPQQQGLEAMLNKFTQPTDKQPIPTRANRTTGVKN